MRSSPKLSIGKTPSRSLGSGNECDVDLPVRIQTRLALGRVGVRDYAGRTLEAIVARFWSKVKKSDGCWLWTASVTGTGSTQHGQFTLPRTNTGYQPHIYAHRLSWELAYGAIPDNLQVCHHCDVPRCVRPDHLFLGTQDDNLKDAARKRRFHTPRTRVFSLADRLAIFHMPERRGLAVELALHYRVTKSCIGNIRHGKFVGAPLQRVTPRTEAGQLIGHLYQQRRDTYVE